MPFLHSPNDFRLPDFSCQYPHEDASKQRYRQQEAIVIKDRAGREKEGGDGNLRKAMKNAADARDPDFGEEMEAIERSHRSKGNDGSE